MRRILLVLVLAAGMVVLLAASATAKPKPQKYCATGTTPEGATLILCGESKKECKSFVAQVEQANPTPPITFGECTKQQEAPF